VKGKRSEDVNQSQSNPLRQELARAKPMMAHPDDDVLTAFAENALVDRERGRVMEHLSTCAECREVLSLATAALPHVVVQQKLHTLPVRPPLRTWLPWLAAAACIVVVSSVVVIHQKELETRRQTARGGVMMAKVTPPSPPPDIRQIQPKAAPAPQASVPQQVTPPAAKSQPKEAAVGPAMQDESTRDTAIVTQQAPIKAPSSDTEVLRSMASQYGNLTPNTGQLQQEKAFPQPQAPPAPPALPPQTAAMAHWRISDTGQAQRSLGSGPWQTVLPDEKSRMRVASVFGSEVWIGGDNLRLYRSEDDGITWRLVQLPKKDAGARAVTHIHFQSGQAGTVEADNGTQWTTVDGGQTWR
jgi:hypothetical protein